MTESLNLRGAVPHFYIRVDGDLASEEMLSLDSVTIESSLHMPDMAVIVLRDNTPMTGGSAYRFVDDKQAEFTNGKPLTISIRVGKHEETKVFDGEIVEVEASLHSHGQRLVVRAFDRLHKLARGTYTRTFQNVTDMDVVKKIASEIGMKAKTGKANFVHDYVLQANQTNLDFLRERAVALGYLLFVEGNELNCVPMESMGHAGVLQWGVNLVEFNPRTSSIGQAKSTTMRGWDPERKQVVISSTGKGKGEPEAAAAQETDLGEEYTLTNRVVHKEKYAELVASGNADERRQKFLEASGVAGGFPTLNAGMTVDIKGVSDRFEGRYTVSSVTHFFQTNRGYTTEFVISGMRAPDIAQTLAGAHKQSVQQGLAIGLVTNNNDPKNQGRVKVKFPWLSEKHESNWARVSSLGGGSKRGASWIPEVDDEVLVGFEQGDVQHPYILGGLWNGKDAQPEPTSQLVKNGKTVRRVLYSRTGHKITLDDSDEAPGISIQDKNGNIIEIDTKTNKLTIKMSGDVNIEAATQMNLKAGAGINIDGGPSVSIKAGMIKLN